MTIEKRANSYRISQMVKGKMYRVTVDHKPTKAEASKLINDLINSTGISSSMPLERACKAYIESKNHLLSVSTIRGYEGLIRAINADFAKTPINLITKPMLQSNINDYAVGRSPKTVSNYGNFLISVLSYYGNEIKGIIFPQKENKVVYIPTEEEVHAIFEAVKGTKYEVPILLSGMGLRRSEICALTPSDLSGNILTINKAKVQDEHGEWHIKTTKTTDSTRQIVLPDYLVSIINEKGFYNGHPELIYRTLTNTEKALGIPHFPLHKMRHFCVSYLHNIGCTDKQIQSITGHKTNHVMNSVYKQVMELDKAKSKIADSFGNLMG